MNRFPVYLLTILFLAFLFPQSLLLAQDQEKTEADEALIRSIIRGDLEAVQAAIEEGADLNRRGKHGFTPYEAARRTGFTQIAEMLVAQGAKTDVEVPTAEQYIERPVTSYLISASPA